MRIYDSITRTDNIIKYIEENSSEILNLIKEYTEVKNKEAQLNMILDKLNELNSLLVKNGYEYQPNNINDYYEDDFEDVLELFGEFIKRYESNVTINDIEILSTETKKMISLIDRHLNGFVNENAINIE